MDTLTIDAYAKVNLGLDVVRRLGSGYHEVRMIMQTVGVYDTLILKKEKSGITLSTDSVAVPTDKNNLVYMAADMLMDLYGIKEGVSIHLEKRIPIAAGLAGGSTDAAAVLKGMNILFSLGLTQEKLMKIGVRLGADIPYCIMGGTALAEGIGEKLIRLPDMPPCFILVAKPDISVSTKYVFENLDLDIITRHPDIDGMAAAIREGSLTNILPYMENVLENVTAVKYPVIKKLKELMEENGAGKALMSGSGPTVFGIYDRKEIAEAAKEKLMVSGLAEQIFVTTFL